MSTISAAGPAALNSPQEDIPPLMEEEEEDDIVDHDDPAPPGNPPPGNPPPGNPPPAAPLPTQDDLQQFSDLINNAVENATTRTRRPTEIKIGEPSSFDGELSMARPWFNTVTTYLILNEEIYNTDMKKVLFALSYMKGGTAIAWANEINTKALRLRANGTRVGWGTWSLFETAFRSSFDYADQKTLARQKLHTLKQTGSIDTYISEFRNLVSLSEIWDHSALIGCFERGIHQPLRKQIYLMEKVPDTIQGWFTKASLFDNNWRIANTGYETRSPSSYQKTRPYNNQRSRTTNAITVNGATLSKEEKDRYFKEGLCFECGNKGHLVAACPNRQGPSKPRFNRPRTNIRATNTEEDPKGKAIAIKALLEGMSEEGKTATFQELGEDLDF